MVASYHRAIPKESLCSRQNSEVMQIGTYQTPYVNSEVLTFRLLHMLILPTLGSTRNYTQRNLRDAYITVDPTLTYDFL